MERLPGRTGSLLPIVRRIVMLRLLQAGGVLLLVAAGALGQAPKAPGTPRTAEKKPPHPARMDLTPATFGQLHALIRPHENEWRHLRVQWLTDVVAARKRAAAEDKPIVICYTGGAGYNEPLGVC
jgi:hypothetical protein